MSDNSFKLQFRFTKVYKDAEGNAFLEEIASGPEADMTGEHMPETALQSMVASIQHRLSEFRVAHKQD